MNIGNKFKINDPCLCLIPFAHFSKLLLTVRTEHWSLQGLPYFKELKTLRLPILQTPGTWWYSGEWNAEKEFRQGMGLLEINTICKGDTSLGVCPPALLTPFSAPNVQKLEHNIQPLWLHNSTTETLRIFLCYIPSFLHVENKNNRKVYRLKMPYCIL